MRYLLFFALLIASPLHAESPRVVTTVAPLYGIASDLMRGIGAPSPIVTQGQDPHDFALKPSQIFALNNAELVFAIGAGMEPWLARVLPGLEAEVHILSQAPALRRLGLSIRDIDQVNQPSETLTGASFDPHFWLLPSSASIIIQEMVEALSAIDPPNRDIYVENGINTISHTADAKEKLVRAVDALEGMQIVTSHDSLQYLDHGLGLNIVGTLSSITGEQAGARSISRLLGLEGPVCLLIDTSEASSDVSDLFPDWPRARYDPLGYAFAGAPDYLGNLYLSLAEALESCITGP